MKDRPIIFSAPMVRALLAGRKTQTRRLIRGAPNEPGWFCDRVGPTGWQWTAEHGSPRMPFKPSYAVCDRLWVRENFSGPHHCTGSPPRDWGPWEPIWFWADGNPANGDWTKPKPAIHMPRWASRITLLVDEVRIQRLQDISEEDALAEGVGRITAPELPDAERLAEAQSRLRWPQRLYAVLWDEINGRGSWATNPWVVALTFRVVHANIDSLPAEEAA